MAAIEAYSERVAAADSGSRARRLLLLSYYFPPAGGGGVQRQLKFAKYLRRFGWDVSVLTVKNPSVPVHDASLMRDVPEGLLVERARTFEPGYGVKRAIAADGAGTPDSGGVAARVARSSSRLLRAAAGLVLQPDPQVLWVPAAARAASRLLARTPHDVLFATAPAYSTLLLGSLLKDRFGLPLVTDFRDEWDINAAYMENLRRDALSRAAQRWMQRYVLKTSDVLVATTKATAARLQALAEEAGSAARSTCIYNGYDEEDFSAPRAEVSAKIPPKRGFRVVYTGTLWNLTSVAPLAAAIEALGERAPEALPRIELVFVGRRTPAQHAILERLRKTRCRLHVEDYCDHEDALAWARSADALCVLLSDVAEAGRVVPAKLFEYLRAQKELLVIAPEGEVADLVREHRAGVHLCPGDIGGIADWLSRRASGGPGPLAPPSVATIRQFSRERLAGELAAVLDEVASRSAARR